MSEGERFREIEGEVRGRYCEWLKAQIIDGSCHDTHQKDKEIPSTVGKIEQGPSFWTSTRHDSTTCSHGLVHPRVQFTPWNAPSPLRFRSGLSSLGLPSKRWLLEIAWNRNEADKRSDRLHQTCLQITRKKWTRPTTPPPLHLRISFLSQNLHRIDWLRSRDPQPGCRPQLLGAVMRVLDSRNVSKYG